MDFPVWTQVAGHRSFHQPLRCLTSLRYGRINCCPPFSRGLSSVAIFLFTLVFVTSGVFNAYLGMLKTRITQMKTGIYGKSSTGFGDNKSKASGIIIISPG